MGLDEMQKKKRSEYLEGNLMITECSQKKPYAFISYASDNWETVFKQAVVPLQRQYGLRVYADKAFDKLNDKWIVPMLRNIRGSDLMIAFVSQNYIESYACFLELLTAVNNKKQIVFVELEQDLRLGDTTDQPNIERGVKNEILNQGANIATNTNNSSNDLMRAMKSAFTSITTLLEQDALSKYDISDAFINFFRDASINKKTINDLGALMSTIKSVSSRVFDKVPPRNAGQQTPHIPAKEQPVQSAEVKVQLSQDAGAKAQPAETAEMKMQLSQDTEANAQSGGVKAQSVRDEDVKERMPQEQPVQDAGANVQPVRVAGTGAESSQGVQTASLPSQDVQTAAEYKSKEPSQKAPAKSKIDLHNKKTVIKLIGAAVGVVVIIIALVLITGPKQVEAMAYDLSIPDGGKAQLYSGLYTGSWKKNMPYEQGTFVYEDVNNSKIGFVYEGEWKDGQCSGQGTATYGEEDENNRRDYVGQWENNKRNGQGTMTWNNGQVYEGEWKDGKYSGQGTLTYAEGNKDNIRDYVGQWENGKRNGQGTMTWNDGAVYEGEWKDNQYSGQGTLTYAEGNESNIRDYVGQWENGKRNGQGTMTWNSGQVYEGEWKDGAYNGQGTMTYAEGNEEGIRDYVGQWANNKKHGQGKMTWDNNEKFLSYEGEWKNNIPDGQGTILYTEGNQYDIHDYVGQVVNGNRHGQGTLTWNDGRVYEGEWKDDHCSGEGTITYGKEDKYNRVSYVGQWENGKKNGQGTMTFTSGGVYEGEWKDDQYEGQGKYTYPSGEVLEGTWKDSEFVG